MSIMDDPVDHEDVPLDPGWPDDLVEDWSEDWADDSTDDWADDWPGTGQPDPHLVTGLRSVLHEDFDEATDDQIRTAVTDVLDTMSPAESSGFAGTLRQIGAQAAGVWNDPAVMRVVQQGLPVGAGAVGAVLGGPTGAAVASRLGSTVAAGLPRRGAGRVATTAGMPASGQPGPAAGTATGSTAAAQAAILLDHPAVRQALVSAALGSAGRQVVEGVPVTDLVTMLSSVLGQAAADADELAWSRSQDGSAGEDAPTSFLDADELDAPGRSLYLTLLDADNAELFHTGCAT